MVRALIYIMRARITAIEQKQTAPQLHMDIIRSDGLNIIR